MAKKESTANDGLTGYIHSEVAMFDWYQQEPCDLMVSHIRKNLVYDRKTRSWHLCVSKLAVAGNIRAWGTKGQNTAPASSNPLFFEDHDWDSIVGDPVMMQGFEGFVMGNNFYISKKSFVKVVKEQIPSLVKNVDGVDCISVNDFLFTVMWNMLATIGFVESPGYE